MFNNISIDAAVVTDKGLVRINNEDNFYLNGSYMNEHERDNGVVISINESNHEFIYSVCDGIGGEEAGEKASLTAVAELKTFHDKKINAKAYSNMAGFIELLNTYLNEVNCFIYKFSTENAISTGTTFAGLVILGNQAAALNVGDSRVYLLRESVLTQLTVDHTEAERLIRLGILTRDTAKNHKSKHMLSRYLGISPDEGKMEATVSEIITLNRGDIFLLCSDGLTDMVDNIRINEIVRSGKSSIEISSLLVNEALNNGGRDNITAMVITIQEISPS